MENKDELIDFYGYNYEIWLRAYQAMGRLLDKNLIANEVKKRKINDIYIYGGGYLGIQFYYAIVPFVNVLSIVDKKGQLKLANENMSVIDMDTFRDYYRDELVVITPIQYYMEIYNELKSFVLDDKMLFLEELWGK